MLALELYFDECRARTCKEYRKARDKVVDLGQLIVVPVHVSSTHVLGSLLPKICHAFLESQKKGQQHFRLSLAQAKRAVVSLKYSTCKVDVASCRASV
jgi:hypothetical protein